jgi:hypothetical protein
MEIRAILDVLWLGVKLPPNPSFGHNLCFNYLNGSWEPILDIYVPIVFQWYKELHNSIGFWPLKLLYENLGIYQDSNSQSVGSLRSVRVHSLALSYTPKSMRCDSRGFLLARTFVSPCLGHEPKARVATSSLNRDCETRP